MDTKHWVVEPDQDRPITLASEGPAAMEPVTIVDTFKKTAAQSGSHPAMRVKINGEWKSITYGEYFVSVRLAAKSLIKLGLEENHAVGIIGFNSPEWFIAELAAIMAGGLAAGVYTTNLPEACHYVLEHSSANVVVAEDNKQVQKIISVKGRLPNLKAIVQYSGEITSEAKAAGVMSWPEFMKAGESIEDAELDARIAKQKPANCCALIYTSGTTGNPKAVMISHDNFTWTARAAMKALTLNPQDHLVSYLPLSHVAAQMLDVITPLLCGCTVWFADSNALKGSLLKTLQEVRPTLMLGVPRVWEKMVEGVKAKGKDTKGFKKTLVDWAKTIGTAANTTREGRADPPWGYWLANTLVFSKLRTALGLDRCRAQFSAAAPISREVTEFMMALNVPIYEIYGMSECTGPQTISTADHFKLGSTGRGIPGVEMKIDSPNKEGDGEICYRGRHVFMGYLHDEQKTREAIDPEGWLHSGDVGRVDEEGYLRITGRIKEILITAGGENVAPVLIEDTIKEEVPIISNCMVIGDRRKFLSLLVTLKSDMDGEGRPLNKVYAGIKSTLVELGCTAETVSEAIKDPKVREYVDAGIKRANERAISNAQRIAKWEFLSEDFSVPGDELGPTLKLKRPIVMKKQATVIEAFYA